MSIINLYNQDCMEAMAKMPDKAYDLAIVDPPYRNQNECQPTKDMRNNRFVKGQGLGKKPNKKYFIEIFRVSKEQIIWGVNNFPLYEYKGFVVWKKKTISDEFTMSMAEIAYISEGLGTTSKLYECAPQGNKLDPRIHPTQKPVALYKWLLTNYAKKGDKILDTHGGSMSIAIACHDLGFDLDLYEIDKDYFEAGKLRLERHQQQQMINFGE